MHLKDLTEFQLSGKRVLLRADMNVPMKGGKITNTERIDRSLPTIKHILEEGGKIIVGILLMLSTVTLDYKLDY